jgi:hypothetical protein
MMTASLCLKHTFCRAQEIACVNEEEEEEG